MHELSPLATSSIWPGRGHCGPFHVGRDVPAVTRFGERWLYVANLCVNPM